MKTIEELIADLPKNEKAIVQPLREIILGCSPDLTEKLSYKVPFYYRYARICFIWPGSLPWGKEKKEGVLLGFCKGHLLSNEQGLLAMEGRKEVSMVTLFSPKEINEAIIREIVNEAIIVDEMVAMEKKAKH
jgi:hypothetical protein